MHPKVPQAVYECYDTKVQQMFGYHHLKVFKKEVLEQYGPTLYARQDKRGFVGE